ncbi:hypothetical protein AgCh_024572 [Apium graveolens]
MPVYGTKTTTQWLLDEGKNAQKEDAKQKRGQNLDSKVWKKPAMGWVKINTDAPITPGIQYIGTDVVIKDEDGFLERGMSMN